MWPFDADHGISPATIIAAKGISKIIMYINCFLSVPTLDWAKNVKESNDSAVYLHNKINSEESNKQE